MAAILPFPRDVAGAKEVTNLMEIRGRWDKSSRDAINQARTVAVHHIAFGFSRASSAQCGMKVLGQFRHSVNGDFAACTAPPTTPYASPCLCWA